jgi:hypothetical protein
MGVFLLSRGIEVLKLIYVDNDGHMCHYSTL